MLLLLMKVSKHSYDDMPRFGRTRETEEEEKEQERGNERGRCCEEEYKIEKLVGCRKAQSSAENGVVSGNGMDYLVKWCYYSYRDLNWMFESELNAMGESQKVHAYKRKFGGMPSVDLDNLFPKEYLEIERIFATKESEEWVEYDDDDDDDDDDQKEEIENQSRNGEVLLLQMEGFELLEPPMGARIELDERR